MNFFFDKIKEIWYYHDDFIICVIIIPIIITLGILLTVNVISSRIQNSEISSELLIELTTWCENKDIAPFISESIKQASADGKITIGEYENIQKILNNKTKELNYSKLLNLTTGKQ